MICQRPRTGWSSEIQTTRDNLRSQSRGTRPIQKYPQRDGIHHLVATFVKTNENLYTFPHPCHGLSFSMGMIDAAVQFLNFCLFQTFSNTSLNSRKLTLQSFSIFSSCLLHLSEQSQVKKITPAPPFQCDHHPCTHLPYIH